MFAQNFSEQQVTAKHFDKTKSEYMSRSEAAGVTDNIMASSCPETDTHITCTFKRKAKPQGWLVVPHDTSACRIYIFYIIITMVALKWSYNRLRR